MQLSLFMRDLEGLSSFDSFVCWNCYIVADVYMNYYHHMLEFFLIDFGLWR